MKKGSKILGILLAVLALGCFAMYFIYGSGKSEYKVVFDSNGGSSVPEQIVKVGEKATKPENPTKDKSDFVEWQLDGRTYDFDDVVENDITLKATWQEYNTFNVKVTLEGQEYTADMREEKPIDIESLNMPDKEGYKIKLYDEDGKEYDTTLNITKDLVLTGKYVEIQTFVVKFDSNGGTKVNDAKVKDGEKVEEPTITRDGYIFDAWYLNNEKYDFNTPVTSNITLKAKWNDGAKYTVTFNADGKVYKTQEVRENTKATKPTDPTKTGYKFVEWQLNDKAFSFDTKITENITLTAKFEQVTSYTVKFDSDGGTTVKQQEVEVGKKATKPTDPTKTGYKFVEWQLSGKTYNFDTVVESNITLKAKWEQEKQKYTVTFNKNNGSADEKVTVTEGEKVTKPADPTKTDYIFEGWIYNNQKFDFSTPITKDITLTARYRLANKYTVTFDSDNGTTVTPQIVTEGYTVGRPANPTRENYTFKGWYLNNQLYDFSKPVTSNITLKASWESTANPDIPSTD